MSWIAAELYHEDCVYICPYGGRRRVVARGRKEISETHMAATWMSSAG